MKKIVIMAIGLFGVTSIAMAGTASTTQHQPQKGFYLGGAGGWGQENETIKETDESSNSSFAWSAFGGYQFMRYFSVELGYNAYPDQDYALEGYSEPIAESKNNSATYLAAKGILPLADSFALYGKLGAAKVHNEMTGPITTQGSHSTTTSYAAAGFSFYMHQQLGLNLEYSATGEDDPVPEMDMVSVALSYHF